ncbi:restriction endonuclease subunit S [Bacteroides finegoldii]|uniref:restriction endonuclease subunit S n=3 Tax=Bacteroides TaxID=816 RepID=UPI002430844C|nr:restriction endonuclease subunit S [Bacteroides finegoldii]
MNAKQLKNSILQWAIQGKLVPQDPNDEPASVLLEKIRIEKARLIKEGKIKKDKNESFIFRGDDNSYYEKFLATGEVKCIDDEIPFEIPQGWEWTRVGNIFFVTKLAGFEYTKFFTKEALSASNPIPIVRAQNVRMGFFEENKNEAISEILSNQLERSALNKKCLLMTFIGAGIGDTCIFPAERKNHLAPNVAKIEPLDDSISLNYAVFALMSPCGQRGVNAIKKSTAQPSLSMETIRKLLIPIPPLKEQKCISLKLSEALPLVEKYSKVQEEQNQLNVEIQYLLKKSILQEAIQGKLVPQIAEEGTAQELLEQIKFEKQKLVKEGKIKMFALNDSIIFRGDDNKYYEQVGKEIKEITEEILFDLPDKWQWCRIGTIFMHNNGKQLNKGNTKGKLMKYVTTSNLYWDGFVLDNLKEMPFKENEIERCMAVKGDLLVCEGGDIGRSCIWNYDFPIMLQNHIHKLRPYIPVCTKFFYYIFNLYNLTGLIGGKGIGIQGFSSKALHNTLVPLPPLKEQHRIVAQIEKLFEQLR